MSDDKGKGISLRRKKTTRPTISAPRQIPDRQRHPSTDSRAQSLWETQTTASSNTNLTVPGDGGGGGKDKTSDLVKRRYSTRFTGGVPQGHGGSPHIPAMPTIPAQYAGAAAGGRGGPGGRPRSPSQDGRSRSPSASGRLKVDMRALTDRNLQAEKYVQSLLADATEADIYAFQSNLQNVKDRASTDLQHNVYQNRTQFIKISKEADRLKSEMQTLRSLMSELTGALGHATSVSSSAENGSLSVADRKRANRSSVANLEAMWSTHLQVLWKRVEGSQKYLPALPGRHIIIESQRWVELNAATWKPRRRVALVLLNDHLLIASEKKRNDLINATQSDSKSKRQSVYNQNMGGAQSQATTYVAERCWALQDVSLADISTSASTSRPPGSKEYTALQNAINIRAGNESFTYATSDNAEKAGLLVAFRKAQEDLRKQIAAEHGERERVVDELSLLSGPDRRLLKKAAAAGAGQDEAGDDKTAIGLSRSNSVLTDVEGRQRSIRSVESDIDKLDIDIAMQRFEDAVARVEELRKLARRLRSYAAASEIINAKVQERATRLAAVIARQLVLTSGGIERTKENVSWLLRLGFEEMARTRYLDARTETIRVRSRQIPFTGPLPPYLHALSFTTFSLLLHTIRTFSASFPASSQSAVVKWAKERVEEFNGHLGRQMSSVDRGSALWEECLGVVRDKAGVLSGVGVDFRGLIGRGLEDGKGQGTGREEVGLGVTT